MVVLRDLRQPEIVLINGNPTKITEFHEAIAKIGFTDIDGFQMHRLLKDESVRLSLFTGEDFLNLILHINDCEDLVHNLEKSHVSSHKSQENCSFIKILVDKPSNSKQTL
jgi:hypothetical protein